MSEVIIKPGGTFFTRSKQYVTETEFVTTACHIEVQDKMSLLDAGLHDNLHTKPNT